MALDLSLILCLRAGWKLLLLLEAEDLVPEGSVLKRSHGHDLPHLAQLHLQHPAPLLRAPSHTPCAAAVTEVPTAGCAAAAAGAAALLPPTPSHSRRPLALLAIVFLPPSSSFPTSPPSLGSINVTACGEAQSTSSGRLLSSSPGPSGISVAGASSVASATAADGRRGVGQCWPAEAVEAELEPAAFDQVLQLVKQAGPTAASLNPNSTPRRCTNYIAAGGAAAAALAVTPTIRTRGGNAAASYLPEPHTCHC